MGYYQIKDLEELSGIKAHTLRIWEHRYKIIRPKRTPTNIRYYSDDDLRLLLNVALLCRNRYKISKISKMSPEEMRDTILHLSKTDAASEHMINELALAMLELDEQKFANTLMACIELAGFEHAMLRIVMPFLKKTGVLWLTNSINSAHEHYVINLLRQKILSFIDQLDATLRPDHKKFILFLPERELHEITLLFAHYIISARGHKVFYLGQNLPFRDLITLKEKLSPDYLLTICTTHPSAEETNEFLHQLSETFNGQKILVSGKRIFEKEPALPENITAMKNFDELVALVA